MNKNIQIFKDHILHDREFLDDIIERFSKEVQQIGELLSKHSDQFYGANTEELKEFFDFLDGNGFEVLDDEPAFPRDFHTIKIIPIYHEEVIEVEEEEQPFVYVETPISLPVLPYTSVETYEGYSAQCEEYVAPREIRFCIRGCLELLQLVPEGRCGSSPVPRPP